MLPFVFCNPLLSCAENNDVLTDDLHHGGDGEELLNALTHLTQKSFLTWSLKRCEILDSTQELTLYSWYNVTFCFLQSSSLLCWESQRHTDDLHLGGDGNVLLRALAHLKQGKGHLRVRHQQDQGNSHTPTSLPMVSNDVGITGYAA